MNNDMDTQAMKNYMELLGSFANDAADTKRRLAEMQTRADAFNIENQQHIQQYNKLPYEYFTRLTKQVFETDIWNDLLIRFLLRIIKLLTRVVPSDYADLEERYDFTIKELVNRINESDQEKVKIITMLQNELNK